MPNVVKIRYAKSQDDTSERYVVPIDPFAPQNVKAIDVTHLEESERAEVAGNYAEYQQYLLQHMKQAFSFEDWLSHTKNVDFAPSWRTFKPAKTEILD